jgi:hypothetical protein
MSSKIFRNALASHKVLSSGPFRKGVDGKKRKRVWIYLSPYFFSFLLTLIANTTESKPTSAICPIGVKDGTGLDTGGPPPHSGQYWNSIGNHGL